MIYERIATTSVSTRLTLRGYPKKMNNQEPAAPVVDIVDTSAIALPPPPAPFFGTPGQGAHQWRIPYTATSAFDYIGTLVVAWAVSALSGIPLVALTIVFLVAGVLLHIVFKVPTHTVTYLGISS